MCCVGGYAAYAVYPNLTFRKKWAVDTGGSPPTFPWNVMDEAVGRGWRKLQGYELSTNGRVPPQEITSGMKRYCGDRYSCVIHFPGNPDVDPLTLRPLPNFLARHSWNLVLEPSAGAKARIWAMIIDDADGEPYTAGRDGMMAARRGGAVRG